MELLKQHFGINGSVELVLVGPQLMRLDNRVLDALQTDLRYVYMRPPTCFRAREAPGGGWFYEWGLTYREHPESMMYEYVNHTLAEATRQNWNPLIGPIPWIPRGGPSCVKRLSNYTRKRITPWWPTYNGLMMLGGGYILAPSHNIGDDAPLENMLTFFDADQAYGTYPLN